MKICLHAYPPVALVPRLLAVSQGGADLGILPVLQRILVQQPESWDVIGFDEILWGILRFNGISHWTQWGFQKGMEIFYQIMIWFFIQRYKHTTTRFSTIQSWALTIQITATTRSGWHGKFCAFKTRGIGPPNVEIKGFNGLTIRLPSIVERGNEENHWCLMFPF